jgi:predicted dehydrogenase
MALLKRRDFVRDFSGATLGLASFGLWDSSPKAQIKSKNKIKVGQIGTAHAHASGKMATIRKLDEEYEVVGIVEPDIERRKALEESKTYRNLKWMSEEQLLNTKGLQAVLVETAVRDLVPAASRCISAGMHIHLDKPAGESLSEFKDVLESAAQKSLAVQMGYMYRYNPAFQFCFNAVQEGWLGKIFEVSAVMSKTVNVETRKKLAEYAGGSMFEIGCHLIDAMITVCGKPEKIIPYIKYTRPEQDNLADNQLAVFDYPKATATIRSTLIEVEGQKRRQFVVCGEKGTIDIRPIEPPQLKMALAKPHGQFTKGYQEIKLPSIPGRYDEQLIEFGRLIRKEKEADYSYSHDLTVHEAVLLVCGLPAI